MLWEAAATFVVGMVLIAVGLVGTSGTRAEALPSRWAFALPLVAVCLLLLAKRRRPGAAALAGTAVLVIDQAMGGSIGVIVGYFDLVYCVALWGRREVLRRAQLLTVVAVLLALVVPFVLTGDLRESALLAIIIFTLLAAPLWWGQSVRAQGELAGLREAEALRAERARMAGELHDALAGNLAAIGIHAEASLTRPEGALDPTTRASLSAIRGASVSASDELRTMVLLLRSAADDDLTAPARLAEVDAVVEQARHSGLDVSAERPDPLPSLPAPVDHAAHRIVQESLTNAAKHAPNSHVRVAIDHTGTALVVTVDNTLTGASPGPGQGMGLRSMRERAEALGGRFDAGPRDDRWRVRAILPTEEGSTP